MNDADARISVSLSFSLSDHIHVVFVAIGLSPVGRARGERSPAFMGATHAASLTRVEAAEHLGVGGSPGSGWWCCRSSALGGDWLNKITRPSKNGHLFLVLFFRTCPARARDAPLKFSESKGRINGGQV